ncbi:MAG: oligosaccharide flippase family protein [Candidatus Sulfotelmatobacter sp.]
MTTPPVTPVMTRPGHLEALRERVLRGSAILLFSTGLVAATNLLYNILIARMLGAAGFGDASALYTLLMLLSAVTLAFQIVTSKFIARNSELLIQAQIYAGMMRRAWQVGVGIAVVLGAGAPYLKSYFNLPAQHDLVLLAVATGVYIPLGVRRGKMQGCYDFRALAINVVVEVAVKFVAALLFLRFGMGVTGVMAAVLLSIVAAYLAGGPGTQYRKTAGVIKVAPFGESMQAVLYFVGQVILSNLDILLVKHFFPLPEAGVYAAVALVGRVVFMLCWSVVSSMFPVTASQTHRQVGRSVLYTGLFLVGTVTSLFIAAVALVPEGLWNHLLGQRFLLGTSAKFSPLLTEYAGMTAIYCIAVVLMMYEISRRTGNGAWVQLGASVILAAAIWRYHDSLSQVILVQVFVMVGLLVAVTIPILRERDEDGLDQALVRPEPLKRLRRVPEEEIIAEFLRSEFYHPEFDLYREDFKHLVEQADLNHPEENFIRRALLFLRRGRLWRELPPDMEWWEIELTPRDLARLRAFPRNQWRHFAGGGFYLTEMIGRIEAELARGEHSRFLKKLREIGTDLRESDVPDAVLLIGIDGQHPLTIIDGNHRMSAAMMTMPESAHRRFRFYCGLSPNMNLCCWHNTDLRSLTRYARHTIRYRLRDFLIVRTLREKRAELQML